MTAPARNYHVPAEAQGATLVAALRRFLPGESWNDVRKLVRQRRVQINGNLCLDEGRKLKTGDVVKVWEHPLAKPVEDDDVVIRYVDAHVVVVEKPAGITTLRHREERSWPARRKQLQPTLDEVVTRLVARRSKAKAPPARGARPDRRKPEPPLPRIRPVHRLDRDTSGLMVFARTPAAEQHLVRQFSRHTIGRKYVAVIHGPIEAQTIESHLVRNRGDGLRGSAEEEAEDSQRAITHVRPIERLGDYTLIECRLETGRTHQIRIHLSEQGHPVCGDRTYRPPPGSTGRGFVDRSGAPRQALHAAELEFDHPTTGERLRFAMKLPSDLAEFADRLRAGVRGQTS